MKTVGHISSLQWAIESIIEYTQCDTTLCIATADDDEDSRDMLYHSNVFLPVPLRRPMRVSVDLNWQTEPSRGSRQQLCCFFRRAMSFSEKMKLHNTVPILRDCMTATLRWPSVLPESSISFF